MKISELALEEAALTALKKQIDDRLKDVRDAMQCELEDHSVKSVEAKLPDGTKVAVISHAAAKPKAVVVDEKAFHEWVRDRTEGAETTVRVVHEVRPAYRTARLAEWTKAGRAEVADTETGEITPVPGVEVSAPDRTWHSVRLTDDGPGAIAAAWRAGQLDLPQLTTGEAP
jgi:hypothetical protein